MKLVIMLYWAGFRSPFLKLTKKSNHAQNVTNQNEISAYDIEGDIRYNDNKISTQSEKSEKVHQEQTRKFLNKSCYHDL